MLGGKELGVKLCGANIGADQAVARKLVAQEEERSTTHTHTHRHTLLLLLLLLLLLRAALKSEPGSAGAFLGDGHSLAAVAYLLQKHVQLF